MPFLVDPLYQVQHSLLHHPHIRAIHYPLYRVRLCARTITQSGTATKTSSTAPGKPYNQAPSQYLSMFRNVADPLHRVKHSIQRLYYIGFNFHFCIIGLSGRFKIYDPLYRVKLCARTITQSGTTTMTDSTVPGNLTTWHRHLIWSLVSPTRLIHCTGYRSHFCWKNTQNTKEKSAGKGLSRGYITDTTRCSGDPLYRAK